MFVAGRCDSGCKHPLWWSNCHSSHPWGVQPVRGFHAIRRTHTARSTHSLCSSERRHASGSWWTDTLWSTTNAVRYDGQRSSRQQRPTVRLVPRFPTLDRRSGQIYSCWHSKPATFPKRHVRRQEVHVFPYQGRGRGRLCRLCLARRTGGRREDIGRVPSSHPSRRGWAASHHHQRSGSGSTEEDSV